MVFQRKSPTTSGILMKIVSIPPVPTLLVPQTLSSKLPFHLLSSVLPPVSLPKALPPSVALLLEVV